MAFPPPLVSQDMGDLQQEKKARQSDSFDPLDPKLCCECQDKTWGF